MTIEFYYGRKHQAVMEAAKAVDAVKEVVDYCTEHYGSLSFGAGETLKLIQSRVAGGGYAVGGASLLDEADFTIANLGNAEKGGGAGEVMWQQTVDDYYLNFYVRNPEYLEMLPEQVQLAISNSLSQVRQYNEMPLKIWKAEQLVGGEEAMDQILHDLFNRELDPMYPYLTYQEFLDACGLTEEDLNLE